MSFLLAIAVCMVDPVVEDIRLQNGYSIQGEVLREKADSLVVDVGVDVLTIPRRAVLSRGKVDPNKTSASSPAPSTGDGRRYGESGHLYATKELSNASVKELVDRYGEAVVLVKTPSGLGSGFLIDDQGHCITNCHVVEKETQITVDIFQKEGNSLVEKSVGNVEIIALTPYQDLALLKIPPRKDVRFTRVYFGFADDIRQGDATFAIGNPEGLARTVTQGIISNRNRNVGGQVFLQTTTQINPGNSGGPLFNAKGQVIGVTNMKRLFSEGLGFAIPINYVEDFLKNRDAYLYNKDNPNTGYHYLAPPRRSAPRNPPPSRSAENP